MNKFDTLVAIAAMIAGTPALATTIDFEGYNANTGWGDGVEDGFSLTYAQLPGGGFASTSPLCQPDCASNGSITFASFNRGSFTIARTDNAVFSLDSFDAAQTFTASDRALDITVTGQGAGGPFVQRFTTAPGAADAFQTFILGAGFDAVTSVTFQGVEPYPTVEFQLDNIVVNAVPEPATWAMMIGGFGLAGVAMRRRDRTSVRFA